MRDPLAPIPAPAADPAFWECTHTPRITRPSLPIKSEAAAERGLDYQPLRLLRRNEGDTHGLDRRSQRRHALTGAPRIGHGEAQILSAAHAPLDRIFGLTTAHGWALVRTISLAPAGLLVHHLDLLDPHLAPPRRRAARAALRALSSALTAGLHPRALHQPSSPLALVGGCLLAARVIADLSTWASLPSARRGCAGAPSEVDEVALLCPQGDGIARIDGELVPMTDPQPQVLAIALTPAARAALLALVRAEDERAATPLRA
ncbi:MAG: hypothetical protein IPK80_21835 [Nannocystis sp.]|nr:hypothetical protein [Nannocystis sp.]